MKICGVTNEDDALLAVAMGADAIGFVFAPSPRQVHPEVVRDIIKRLPHDTLTVGVFRNETPERVIDIVGRTGLKGVQLHGGETAEDVRLVRLRVPFVIQALPAGDARLAGAGAGPESADVVLVDSASPGSGEVFDWSLAEGAPSNRRVLLCGGLTPENVTEAIERVRPWGVDVSTGVESGPGRKDARKVREFVRNAKAAAPRRYRGDDEERPFDWEDDEY